MRYLYYCTTPFQTLIAMNMQINQTLKQSVEDEANIVLVDIFNECKAIAGRLSKEYIFDHVFIVKEEAHKSIKNGNIKFFQIALNTILPKTMVRYQFGTNAKFILEEKYDAIISSVFCHPVAALLTLNPKSSFIMMDDGLASYFGNWTSRIRSKSYLRLLKVRNCGKDVSKPSSLYVMRKELCKSTVTDKIFQLAPIDNHLLMIAKRVFGIDEAETIYRENIILLSQPNMDAITIEVFGKILDKLKDNRRNVIVRPHPREKEYSVYQDFSVDKTRHMWELLVDNEDIENKLLITSYSTAVFTPKLLYDREPWIVFLHRMVGMNDEFEPLIKQLRNSYRNKKRICEVNSLEEFCTFYNQFNRTIAF